MTKTEVQMQSYETVFITSIDIKEDDLNKVLGKIKEAVSKNEGEISKLEKWQQRELAYPINDLTKGVYYIAEYKANSGVVSDIESSFKFLREEILRFLTVKVKLAKVKPVKPEPVKPEPVKPEPVKPEPVKPEPVKPEPVKPEPAKTEPENTDNSAFKTPDAKPTEKGGES
ncbi:MAG: 30S ribosomal protein S6 [Deltaproteobacteria bacterium]|nr:MAG: 30S ribosomal protein S6 [Deltaproteobacteria bacterium]